MNPNEIIVLAGIIVALVWLGTCFFTEGKKRKYVIMAGIAIDIILFIICRDYRMLSAGLLGGLACGLMPQLTSVRKYEIAIREFKGIGNWIVVSIIFLVMLCMVVAIALVWNQGF